jgi:paraquat-inducible protein A
MSRWRHNRNAALLAFVALLLLIPGVSAPFMTMAGLGQERTYSLVGGIVALFEGGSVFLGALILTFSLVFPFAKLVVLLAITSSAVPVSSPARRKLHYLASVTAKYSMLDVFVLAILVVVLKPVRLTEFRPGLGTYLFCLSVLGSTLAGACVSLPHVESTVKTEGGAAPAGAPVHRRRYGLPIFALIAALILAGGLGLWWTSGPGSVSRILLTRHGLVPDLTGHPDLYIELVTPQGNVRTGTRSNAAIGNGMEWQLEAPLALESISEALVMDEDALRDDQLDRVAVRERKSVGQTYTIELLGDLPARARLGRVVAGAGGALLLCALGGLVFRHAG